MSHFVKSEAEGLQTPWPGRVRLAVLVAGIAGLAAFILCSFSQERVDLRRLLALHRFTLQAARCSHLVGQSPADRRRELQRLDQSYRVLQGEAPLTADLEEVKARYQSLRLLAQARSHDPDALSREAQRLSYAGDTAGLRLAGTLEDRRFFRQSALFLMLLLLVSMIPVVQAWNSPRPGLERRLAEVEESRHKLLERYQAVDHSHRLLKADVSAAARIQRALLPQSPPTLPGVEVAWIFRACSQVAGDMFNVLALDENHLGVYVLDVSGHGVPAALLSVSVGRVLHPDPEGGGLLRRPRQGQGSGFELTPPGQVAACLNRLFQSRGPGNHYFSLLYGILDLRSGLFKFVRAAHPAPLLLTDSSPFVQVVECKANLPIGVLEDVAFLEDRLQLAAGERLFLFTDGLTEAHGPGGAFGEERLLECLRQNRSKDTRTMTRLVHDCLADFTGDVGPRDDVTALCVAWTGRTPLIEDEGTCLATATSTRKAAL